jgi:hypothetical protein
MDRIVGMDDSPAQIALTEHFRSLRMARSAKLPADMEHVAHSTAEDSVAFNVQPRKTGQLSIGSSRQFGAEHPAIDYPMLARMLRRAQEYMPGLEDLAVIRSWTGFRAATPGKLPLIGPCPGHERLNLATGHEGPGITASLATGKAGGGPDLASHAGDSRGTLFTRAQAGDVSLILAGQASGTPPCASQPQSSSESLHRAPPCAARYNAISMPSVPRAAGRSAAQTRTEIEAFLKQSRQPALLEPGEELLALTPDNFALDLRGERLTLQAWDRTRNLARRVTGIKESTTARMELAVERFPRREGQLYLLDLGRRAGADLGRRSGRLVFRERFRLFLRRQFPEWNLAELSAEANLEFSLSPAFPRAFLRHGQHGWAAIACPPEGDASALLAFGLIWLSYLRARERRVTVEGLALYLPAGHERSTALRLLCLDPAAARFELFSYSEEDFIVAVDPRDHGNVDTRLEQCSRAAPNQPDAWRAILALPGVERIPRHDGRTSLRVRGIEFAELAGGDLLFGMAERRPARPHHAAEIERLVEELDRARSPEAAGRNHPLYRQYPEAWLESQVRARIETLDASLRCDPIYGQVPAFAGGERGVLDLLAVDHSGRLAVLELKASADLQLPLQALDYWIRVKWHLDRGEFASHGYFPGIELRPEPPRLLLVSPSLEFHPTSETILCYFAPTVAVERIGLAVEWRKGLKVMFRLTGAEPPR